MSCRQLLRIIAVFLPAAVVACGGEINLPNDTTPARMDVVSGDGQSAPVGSVLPDPLVVRLVDASEHPVAGMPVVFRFTEDVPESGIAPATSETDSTGSASATVRLGSTTGSQSIEATIDAAAPNVKATFDLTALKEKGRGKGGDGKGADDKHGDKEHGD
jgi:hypothetical protein